METWKKGEKNAIENFEPTKKAETIGLTHLIKNFIDQDFHSSFQMSQIDLGIKS
jgi:hypothetical protein